MKNTKTFSLIVVICLSIFGLANSFAIPQAQLSDEAQRERAKQIERVHILIRDGNIDRAELLLSGLPDQSSWGVAGFRANICIRRDDHLGALAAMRTMFEPYEKKSIGGAERERSWYYLLLLERGDYKNAARVRNGLLGDLLRKPGGSDEFYSFEKASRNSIVGIYLYMAAYEFAVGNRYRTRAYHAVVKSLDRTVEFDEVLVNQLKRVRTTPEAELRSEKKNSGFPMLPDYNKLMKMVPSK